MTDAIVWAEKLPDIIKKWILTLPMVVGAIGASVSAYHYTDKQDVIKSKNQHIHEVAKAFQNQLAEKEPKPQIQTCGNCNNSTLKKRINELEKWHK